MKPHSSAIGHELRGRHESALRMTPADERLGADDRAGLQIHLRLVVQHELLPLEGAAQAALERLPLDGADVHVRLEELIVVAPAVLGVVHRGVRILDQCLRVLPSSG